MRIETERVDDVLKVRPLERRIDASLSADFRELMTEWIDEGSGRIVLDLSAVRFVDSTGLGAIISSYKAARKKGDMVISGARGAVKGLLEITKLDKVLRIFETDVEAIEFFRGRGS